MARVKRRAQKKLCPFASTGTVPYYRDVDILSQYISERKKILPSVYTGVSAKYQRQLTKAIKQARHLGLLPFVSQVS